MGRSSSYKLQKAKHNQGRKKKKKEQTAQRAKTTLYQDYTAAQI